MRKFNGWGLRINSPGQISMRFSRDANQCIRCLFFKPTNSQKHIIVYTYDGKIENFSPNISTDFWSGNDTAHTLELNLQKGMGSNNENCGGSQTCDQCNAFGVEQVSGTWAWTSSDSNSRVRVRSTLPANIPAANFP